MGGGDQRLPQYIMEAVGGPHKMPPCRVFSLTPCGIPSSLRGRRRIVVLCRPIVIPTRRVDSTLWGALGNVSLWTLASPQLLVYVLALIARFLLGLVMAACLRLIERFLPRAKPSSSH